MIAVGATVGNYRVIEKIGQGAMGAVWLATHPVIGKRVALKVIHAELANNEEMVGRFFNEARAVTQIGHENIVDVQDFGQTPEGDNFIVMELLEGQGLGDRMKAEGHFSTPRAVHIALQIADGLAAAHARGIIHRDLKPDNIILIPRGGDPDFVKILDFGLAKLTGPGAFNSNTKTGSLLGTPHYMAPEQAEGKKTIDHRVDVYGLGCIVFQMLTGRVPFPGDGFGEVLVKHLREPPPLPSRINPEVPPAIEKIVLHALAKKPEFRFKSMEEFRTALRDPERFAMRIDASQSLRLTPDQPMPAPKLPAVAGGGPPPSAPLAPGTHAAPQLAQDAPTMQGQAPPEVQALLAKRQAEAQAQASTGPVKVQPRVERATVAQGATRRRSEPPRKRGTGLVVGALVGLGLLAVFAGGFYLLRLRRSTVSISLITTPPGAEVTREGKVVGQTPLVLALPHGENDVVLSFRKDGFLAAQRSIKPLDDQDVKLRLLPRPQEEPPEPKTPEPPPAPPTATPTPMARPTPAVAPRSTPAPTAAAPTAPTVKARKDAPPSEPDAVIPDAPMPLPTEKKREHHRPKSKPSPLLLTPSF